MSFLQKQKIYEIEYKRWGQVIVSAQLVIACVVGVVEVVANILLYITRSQGYSPETIGWKLFRYLFLTSVINFGIVFISKRVDHRIEDENKKKYLLMFLTVLICTDVAYSHYQFAVSFAIFVIPIVISILYEDDRLSLFTLGISLIGQTSGILARGFDDMYNRDISPEASIAYALPISVLIFARMINSTLEKRRNEAKEAVIRAEKANANAEKMAFSFTMLETLASTIDAKDKYTNGHSFRVAIYATKLAEAMGWDEERIAKLRYEALLHDIGKIGVPDMILNKPSRLSEVEFGLIKSHTVVGADILKNMVAVPNASEVARHHHERFDGKGYPSGLQGYEIPINARVVGIADSFDAMSTDRIYRKALTRDVIRKELVEGRGSQFDPELLDVFLELFDNNKLELGEEINFMKKVDEEQRGFMEDVEKVMGRLTSMEEQRTSLNEFDKFYTYMKNIGMRYNRSIEVLSIDIIREKEEDSFDIEDDISDVLQIAIRKNIRSVDVYYRYSVTKHMLILLDAGIENIDVIQQRIQYDFDSNEMSQGYKLSFALNESIEAPKKDEEDKD